MSAGTVVLLKINGWPDTFDERAEAIADAVDRLVVVRPRPDYDSDLAEVSNVTVHDVPPRRGSYVTPWLKPLVFSVHVCLAVFLLASLVARRDRRPDAIHALDYALGGVVGGAVARLWNVPFVVSVRGLKEPRYRDLARQRGTIRALLNYEILTRFTRFTLHSADHVVTKAPYQVAFVREQFGVDPGFSTLPTGVDFDVFDPKTVEDDDRLYRLLEREGLSLDESDRVVLYLAKLLPEKGADRILELVRETDDRLPDDVTFVFVGEFRDEEYEREVRTLHREVSDRVLLYSKRVAYKAVPSIVNAADAVVLFSEAMTEGAPRILQESLAMGTPVVASDVAGISDSFGGLSGVYLVDRDDPEQFLEAVTSATDPPGATDREAYRDRFDMTRNYRAYADIYASLGE